jgi:hypothetical protein
VNFGLKLLDKSLVNGHSHDLALSV